MAKADGLSGICMTFDEQIDAVPWESLHHAYGPATDVPDLLRALMSPETADAALRDAAKAADRKLFDHVCWTLWGNVFHQGSIWQVTATTVPFFAAILRDGPDDTDTKVFLITYLHHLATGYPDDRFPDIADPDHDFAEVDGMKDPGGAPDYGADDNRPLIWMRDSYEAVERHIEDVLPYLEHDDPKVSGAAISLCASFPRRADVIVPHLRELASAGDRRGATAALSLAALQDPEVRNLAEPMIASSDLVTSVLGACSIAILDPERITPEAVLALTRPLDGHGDTHQDHAGTLRTLVGRCVVGLGPEFRERAVAQVCEQLAEASPMEALSLTENLLQMAFPDAPPPSNASELSNLQRSVMEAIRDHGPFVVAGGIFGNFAGSLRAWGLPDTSEGLKKWLRKRRFGLL